MVRLYKFFVLFLFLSVSAVGVSYSQTISGISPSNANLGQALTVSISGQSTSFGQGTSTTNVWFSQGTSTLIYPVSSTVINSGQVDADFLFPNSLTPGVYDVNVLNSIDGQMSVPAVFMLNPNPNPPVIASANPSVGVGGQSLQVTITGQYTNFGQGTSTANVWFSQGTSTLIYPTSINVVNDTKINADFDIPMNAVWGNYDVNTSDDLDGDLILSNGFQINGCTFPLNTNQANITCYGSNNGSVAANPGGGTAPYTYQWSPTGHTTQSVSSLSSGTYWVTVSDQNGCTATTTVSVAEPGPLTTTFYSWGDTCGDGSATMTPSGGTPGYSYFWGGPNGNTPTATSLNAGTHSVVITDMNGCSIVQTFTVTAQPITVTVTAPSTLCEGQNATLTAVAGSVCSWVWSTGATTASISVSPTVTTTYSVTATYKWCADAKMSVVTVHNSSLSISMVQDTLNPLTWYLQPTITGTAPFNYLWDFGDGNTSTLSNPNHNYAVAGHYAICLTVTDANGCINYSCDSTYKIAGTYIQNLIVLNTLTGIHENENFVGSISPNPANSTLFISLDQVVKGTLFITDIMGREVYADKISGDNFQIDVSRLPIGYYTLSIVSETNAIRERIMIAR